MSFLKFSSPFENIRVLTRKSLFIGTATELKNSRKHNFVIFTRNCVTKNIYSVVFSAGYILGYHIIHKVSTLSAIK